MKPLVIFSLLLLSVSSFGQDRLSYLKNIELLLEEEHYEDLLAQKSELEKHTLETDTLSASIYSVFGECHLILNDLSEAEFYYVKSLDLLKQLNQNVTGHYSNVLYNLTDVYLASGKFDNAFSSAKELVSLDKELYGSKSPLYLETLFFYTDILIETGQYIQALKALKQVDGKFKDDFLNALILTKKGDILTALGNYEKSVDFLESSLDTYSQLNDTLSFTLAQASLGLNYIGQGKYPQAENVLLQSRKAFEGLPETEFYVDNVNSNIALAQMALGRSNQAIAIYEELLHKDSAYFGVVHPKYLTSLINVGMAYNDIDDHNKAESYMLKALTIVTDIYGEKSKNEASIYTNLGIIKREKGDFDAALNAFDSAEELFINSTGKETIEFSTVKFNKGVTLLLMDSDLAEKELISSLKLRKSLVGIGHPKYAESTNYLGLYYWKKSDLKNARKYFEETFINFFDQIQQFFPVLSEEEKTKFYFNNLKPAFEQYASLSAQLMNDSPDILGELYNYQLRTKGIIMVATEKLRRNIYESGDSTLIIDFENWKQLKERLSKLYSNNDPRKILIDSLKESTNTLERSLVRRSSTFAFTYATEIPTWQEVQSTLKEDEVAMEIIRYRVVDLQKGGELTNTIHYLALFINKKSTYPTAVLLERGNLMEGRYLNNYRNSIRYQIGDKFTYTEMWEPLLQELKGYKKIYISPDGVYNQINLNTLINPSTGDYLIKEFIIQEVTSTRDLLSVSQGKKEGTGKLFFGFPTYTSESHDSNLGKKERSLRGGLRGGNFSETRGLRGGLLRYMRSGEGISTLPGTKKEVEEIANIYETRDEEVKALLTVEANETQLKQSVSPEILHIATHGYFLANPKPANFTKSETYYQNPLLRAGLIMAGAEDFLLTGSNSLDDEDGILTAYEAMNMELNNTDLVVLSACETGLGEVANGEGVFGLQRAFKLAGAQNIVMSMWNVDDDATQRLMTLFYTNLDGSRSKFDAFREAQLQLMQEYDQPFYWGAFKIVGE